MIQFKRVTPKNYNVITTFNYDRYYYGRVYWMPGMEPRENSPLPNAPMVARHTLLAHLLRKGRHLNEGFKFRQLIHTEKSVCPKDQTSLTGRLLGIEIEYYPKRGDEVQRNALTYTCDDGSLDSGGSEIRRLTWASKSGRLEGLLRLKLAGAINKKCGLHVHVDARHLGSDELLSANETYGRLIELYPMLKKLVPKSRLRNKYCRWADNRDSGDRYAAINFCSFREHGTIEFRCQGGTVNLVKIESWALLCQFLVNFAANPINTMPSRWSNFLAVLPEPLRSWCILRKEKLYGNRITMNERTMSAMAD